MAFLIVTSMRKSFPPSPSLISLLDLISISMPDDATLGFTVGSTAAGISKSLLILS